jgi:hypothetical protein
VEEAKSLKEVWEWKEEVYRSTKGMSKKELINHFNKTLKEIGGKYNQKLKKKELVKA